jgi:cytochrome oxidase assembly protein ShyY1
VVTVYSFARRPLWILSHVLVLVGVIVMVRLGFWQLSRWQEESEEQDRIEAALEAEPVPLDEVVELATPPGEVGEDLRYRRVVVEGTWRPGDTVVVRNRALQGSPGGWLVTPLLQADGTAVAVVRGWVDLQVANGGAPFPGTEPPEGQVVVVGSVNPTQRRGAMGPSDPDEGRLDSLARVDLERLAAQVEVPIEPVWVLAEAMEPSQQGSSVQPVEAEVPSPSQNFSYMVQWWIFATIAALGYLLVLYKVARMNAVAPSSTGSVGDGDLREPRDGPRVSSRT